MLLRGQESIGFRDKKIIGNLSRNSFRRGVRTEEQQVEKRMGSKEIETSG